MAQTTTTSDCCKRQSVCAQSKKQQEFKEEEGTRNREGTTIKPNLSNVGDIATFTVLLLFDRNSRPPSLPFLPAQRQKMQAPKLPRAGCPSIFTSCPPIFHNLPFNFLKKSLQFLSNDRKSSVKLDDFWLLQSARPKLTCPPTCLSCPSLGNFPICP